MGSTIQAGYKHKIYHPSGRHPGGWSIAPASVQTLYMEWSFRAIAGWLLLQLRSVSREISLQGQVVRHGKLPKGAGHR